MKIAKLTIQHFRSLSEVSFQPGGFNILVGRNNHGKSNVFEAVEWFYLGKGELSALRNAGAPGDGARQGTCRLNHAANG